MKNINIGSLRKLIREIIIETISQDTDMPGRYTGRGAPADEEDLERLGNDGNLSIDEEEENEDFNS